MKLFDLTPASIGEIPYLIHRVTATVKGKIIKEWAVLGIIHTGRDASGTGRKCAELLGMKKFIGSAADYAINRIRMLNYTEKMQGGEPLYPEEAVLSAEPMEFEVEGVEEITRGHKQSLSNALASMNNMYEELSLLIDPHSNMSHDQKVERLKILIASS